MNLIQKELLNVGIQIDNIYDLVNTRESYPEAIPVLLSLIASQVVEDIKEREGIVRALAVKEAVGKAGTILINEYNRTSIEHKYYRWAIGNTMCVVIVKEDLESVLQIVSNKKNGMSRQMFVMALGKLKSEKDRSEDTLISLMDDDEVAPHALDALGKLRSKKAADKIRTLINHDRPLIRKEAVKALKRIEK